MRRTLRWTVVMLAVALAGCGTPGPAGPADSFGHDFSMPSDARTDGAIVFVIDGLNAAVFDEMLRQGELPAFQKYFVDRGLYCPQTVSNIPSVTLACLTSIATGQFPGHHEITGVNWFDRNTLVWRSYETIAQKNTLDGDYHAPTIFEYLPDRTTFSVFFQPHRGATKFVENWTSAGPPFFFGWYEFVDRLTLFRLNLVAQVARARREWPGVTVVYLLAPDFQSYAHGAQSRQYRQAIAHSDRQIGRVLGDLQRAGLLDKLHIAVVSDHGHGEVRRHIHLADYLRTHTGLDIAPRRLWDNTPFEDRLAYYDQFPAVIYGSGDRYAALSLRRPRIKGDGGLAYEPWTVRPSAEDLHNYPITHRCWPGTDPAGIAASPSIGVRRVDLVDTLAKLEAVDVVAYRAGPDAVRVRRGEGEVEFTQPAGRGGPIAYRVIRGSDPLGWHACLPPSALAGQPLSGRAWLEATVATGLPDLPEQILAYFRGRRAGDLAIFAVEGWDFNTVNKAGHGGVRPADMLTPMLLVGPGVPHRRLPCARSVDLMPTLLEALGRPAGPCVDGRSLVEKP